MFTKEELAALSQIVAAAPVTGKDARFIANLLDKIVELANKEKDDG